MEDYSTAADMIEGRLENKAEAIQPEVYIPIFAKPVG